jgi:hypothetical protein
MDVVEKVEKKAAAEGWIFKNHMRPDVCSSCGRTVRSGFLLSPGMNYPICTGCAEKEFK